MNLAQAHRDLHDEIDELRERIRQLEDMLSGPTGGSLAGRTLLL